MGKPLRRKRGSRSPNRKGSTSGVSAPAPSLAENLEPRRLLSGVSFPSGFTTANTSGVLALSGGTVISGTSLELTNGGGGEDGSAFSDATVSTEGFSTTFTFTQTGSGTLADGFCFVLQNNSPAENLGTAAGGGSLGYAGMPNSIAVKFDLYQNVSEGNDSTGLFVEGDAPTVPSGSIPAEASVSMSASNVKLTSGDPMSATLTYNGITLSETVTDTKINASFITSYTVNIPSTIGSGTAYVGFTGATGGATSTQKIGTWSYTNTTSAPYAPSSISASSPSSTEVDLSWAEPYSTVNSYNIYRENAAGTFVQVGVTGATTFPNTGLTANTTYTYEIQAVNSQGSAYSAPFTTTTPTLPTVISNLTASGISTSAVTLSWTDGSGITSISVTRTLIPDNTVVTTTLGATATSYSDSGLLPGRQYNYAVSGTITAGPTQATTVAVQTVPGQPQNVDTTINGTTVTLEWDALGGAVTGYNIYRGTSPGGEGPTPIATNVPGFRYSDPNLTTGVTYYYVVTAVDSGGEGVPSGEVSALASVATPDLVISEFMADNKTGLKDSAGAFSDWIEIHNAGSGAADLSQYYLTDSASNPELWQFPVQTLAGGGYLVVFADGANVAVANQELHTNFDLSSAGEYLALIGANDIPQFQYSPSFPVQTADISYGLSDSDDPTSAFEYFGAPTPGAANAPTAQEVVFSQVGETFSGSISVTLTDSTPGESIRYTLNSTAPTSTSTLYTGPITVSSTEDIYARAFATGYTSSVVDSQTYIALAANVASFSNNIGIVVIDTFGQALNDSTDVLAAATFIPATNGTASALGGISSYDGQIGLHIRGNTSESFPKQQWGITLWDDNQNNQKASIMGMPSDSKWILNDPYSEKSLLQNPLAYQWAAETGEYASRTQFVEVFLNTTGSTTINYNSNYWGVYVLEERIKISNNRVNINQMSPTDNTAPADTGGYIWELDRPDSSDATFTTATEGITYIYNDPSEGTITSAQESYLAGYVNSFEAALYGSNFQSPTAGYAAYINVQSFVNTWLIEEMIKNIDGFRLSTYYYKDENGLINAGPIWDNNLGLGNANYTVNGGSNPLFLGSNPDGWDSAQLTGTEYPYYPRLFQDPAFTQAVTDRWSQLRSTVFSNTNLVANINTLVNELSNNTTNYPIGANGATPTQPATDPVVRNFEKWPVLGVWGWPNGFYDPSGRWIVEVQMTENWVLARVAWMDSQLLPAPAITPGGVEDVTTSVTISPYTNVPADTVLLPAGAPAQAFVPTGTIANWTSPTFNSSSWTSGTTGVGFDNNNSGFASYIGLNTSAMYNVNQTVYIRTSFNISNLSAVASLILEMRYSGGFVAYINGVQVATANASVNNDFATDTYNSGATALQSNSAAITYQAFDISVFKYALVAGNNVLAIQGMNDGKTTNDFLIEPLLVSRITTPLGASPVYYTTNGTDPRNSNGTISSAAVLYTGSMNFSSNTTVEARSYTSGVWSGLATSVYQFARPTIAITELNYDPAKPPLSAADQQNDDYEFIEFENYGTQSLNLNGIAFTNGIKYTFGNVSLAPGQVGVLVHNTAAFQSRYGTAINILGDYSSTGESFNNSGEEVALVDPLGNTLSDFIYSSSWYASTHQGGSSLEVVNPSALPNLNLASSWQASTVTNGTPGTIELNLTGSAYLKMDAADQYLDIWNTATPAGAFSQEIPLSSLNLIDYSGTAAGAGLTVDFSNGDPLIASGLLFNGGTGSLASLSLVGTSGSDSLTVNASTLVFSSSSTGLVSINYSNASGISFNGSSGSDVLTQAAQPGAAATLSFTNTTSADTLNVLSGTYTVPAPAAGSGIVTTTLGTVSISAGTSMTIGTANAHSDRNLLVVSNLGIAGVSGHWTGRLDLGGNDLELVNGVTSTVWNQLAQGLGGSTNGIVSTAALADTTHLTTLGMLRNQTPLGVQLYGNGTALGLFDGIANPGPAEVLVKYTYYGDSNLTGKIDGTDYGLLDNGYGNHTTLSGWYNGDLNYDGTIDGSDYTLMDNAFNTQGTSLAAVIAAPTAAEVASPATAISTSVSQASVTKATVTKATETKAAPRLSTASNVFQTQNPITLPESTDQAVELLLQKKDLLDTLAFAG